MALFQPILGNLSGSVGANTFAHNKGGPYTRRRAKPVNNTSVRRTVVRGYMSTSSRTWGTLSDAQRASWTEYAAANPVINRQGVSTNVSGINMFNRLNTRIADFGGSALVTAPSSTGPQALASLSAAIVGSTGVATLTFTVTPLFAGQRLGVWWTRPTGAGKNPNFNQAVLVGYSASAQASTYAVTLPSTAATGAVINLYVAVVDTAGRTSPVRKVRVVAS